MALCLCVAEEGLFSVFILSFAVAIVAVVTILESLPVSVSRSSASGAGFLHHTAIFVHIVHLITAAHHHRDMHEHLLLLFSVKFFDLVCKVIYFGICQLQFFAADLLVYLFGSADVFGFEGFDEVQPEILDFSIDGVVLTLECSSCFGKFLHLSFAKIEVLHESLGGIDPFADAGGVFFGICAVCPLCQQSASCHDQDEANYDYLFHCFVSYF